MSIETMKQALEALLHAYHEDEAHPKTLEAITALRQAIEQDKHCKHCTDGCLACDARKLPEQAQKQEPDKYAMDIECTNCGTKQSGILTVNTTPPQRQSEQEPVAWMYALATRLTGGVYGWEDRLSRYKPNEPSQAIRHLTPLYTTPPQRQPEQKPIGYVNDQYSRDGYNDEISVLLPVGTAIFTSPPPRQPLSDEEIFEISNGFALFMFPVETRVTDRELAFAKAIEEAVNKQPRIIPLTDDEMWKLWNAQGDDFMEQQAAIAFARAIEAAHGITGEQK